MRFLSWFILAYVALGMQMGMGEFVRVRGGTPNVALLAVIFIALWAERDAALLACFCIGVMQDLTTLAPLGLYALSYSLVGLLVTGGHDVVDREHPATHVGLAFVGGVIVGIVLIAHGLWRGPRVPLGPLFASVLYSSILAPILLFVLQRMRRIFAFGSRRRFDAFA
jgi:rod shape-determining protein MreD